MVRAKAGGTITGLAADAKPSAAGIPAGTNFIETDSRKRYYNSGTDWILQEFPALKKYSVFKVGSTTYVTDQHGKIANSNTDTQLAIQPVLDSLANNQTQDYYWDADVFTLENPIILPYITGTAIRQVRFFGVQLSRRAATGGATSFTPGAGFPTNRYFIESHPTAVAPASGGSTCDFTIEGVQGFNIDYIGTKNVGFLKYEADGITGRRACNVKDVSGAYMWRLIHLKGLVWFGSFQNISSTVSNTAFTGDAAIILEDGGHANTWNPTPKANRFSNTMCFHGDGLLNDFIRLQSGAYNIFDHAYIDGKFYANAPITLNNTDTLHISNNTFRDILTIDMEAPTSDTRKASLWMSGTNVYDNRFINCKFQNNPKGARMDSTGVYRNEIELTARWGASAIIVDDTGSGESNVVVVRPGNRTTAGETPITHTGGVSRIIDTRRQATRFGDTTFSGDGTTVTFNIPHGCFATPQQAWVGAGSIAARGTFSWTVNATNIVVTYPPASPPVSGGSNIIFHWKAEVYP